MINQKGFTLLEYIIYIAIVALVLVAMVDFAWVLLNDQAKQEVTADTNDLGVHIVDQITYYGQRAESFGPATVFDVSPGKLVLEYGSESDMVFETYSENIMVGDTQVQITKLRMEEVGGEVVDLTSERVDVTNFVITNMSGTQSSAVSLDLTLTSVNPEQSKVYEAENSWSTTITFRAQ